MIRLVAFFAIISSLVSHAQDNCNLKNSAANPILAVDTADIKCISQNSAKPKTLFFTFGIWCSPCRAHLPGAIKLAADRDLDFYVLLLEKEDDQKTADAIVYLRNLKPDIKIAILKDSVYGEKRTKKNKKFVAEITPKEFEVIDDYSKYILLDQQGQVLLVTNWKDNRDSKDWRDDSAVHQKIISLLSTVPRQEDITP